MKKELYEKYLNLLLKLKVDRPEWIQHPNAWIEDMYHAEKGPFAEALKILSNDVVSCLDGVAIPKNRQEANALFDSVVDYIVQRMEDISSISFTYGAAEFITKVYMDYFGYPQSDTSIDDLDENIIEESVMVFDVDSLPTVDACRQTLVKYQDRLKNLSRNNRLINFKQQKNTMMSFCHPSARNLFRMLMEGRTLTLVNWERANLKQTLRCRNPECGKYMFRKYATNGSNLLEYCPSCDGIKGKLKHMTPLDEAPMFFTDNEAALKCSFCGKVVKLPADLFESKTAQSILCPACGKGLLNSYPYVFLEDLKGKRAINEESVFCSSGRAFDVAHKLISRDKNMRKNFGLHALYMVFGFLNWSDNAGLLYRSPLLLLRVLLYQDANKNYCITIDGDKAEAVSINKTLEYVLRCYSRDLSFTLPTYEKEELSAYFHRIKKEITKFNLGWTIDESAVLGMFNHQKSQLEEEIKEHFDEYLANPFINRLCGGWQALPNYTYNIHGGEFSICDADASQQYVIDKALSGESFILQGPPGSGKSQTITNLITEFISRGKTVLFVTQKSTARAIIYNNMRERSVGDSSLVDYCLTFDTFTSNANGITKKSFKNHLNEIFNKVQSLSFVLDNNIAGKEAEIEDVRDQLCGNRDEYLVDLKDSRVSIMQLIDVFMRYADEKDLELLGRTPATRIDIDYYNDVVEKFYGYLPVEYLNYKTHPLYGFHEQDYSASSLGVIAETVEYFKKVKQFYMDCAEFGIESSRVACPCNLNELSLLAEALNSAALLPIFETKWVYEKNKREWAKKLLSQSTKVKARAEVLRDCGQRVNLYGLTDKAKTLDIREYLTFLNKKKFIFARFGKSYNTCMLKLVDCKINPPLKMRYKDALEIIEQIQLFQTFQSDIANFEVETKEKYIGYGMKMDVDYDWATFCNRIASIVRFYENVHTDKYFNNKLFELMTEDKHDSTVQKLAKISSEINLLHDKLKNNLTYLQTKFDREILDFSLASFNEIGNKCCEILENKPLLPSWIRFTAFYDRVKEEAQLQRMFEVLISNNVTEISRAKGSLLRNYWTKYLNEILSQSRFKALNTFARNVFEHSLQRFRSVDKENINNAAQRAYSILQNRKVGAFELMRIAYGEGATFLNQRDTASLRDLIKNNWEVLSKVKPCFMLSPLTVAQYIDSSIKFDLVVFDESSQIFVEDALATIFRGKQVVVAGDLQQLPPVNFFRADSQKELEEEDESAHFANVSFSILNEAQKMLEKNYALRWHYRSYDEALITFSNRNFYNNSLLTFPTAAKVDSDGIFSEYIQYDVNGCYESGKGQHINRNEALRIIERVKDEICNFPEHSVGIVAFSAAQAEFIEKLWMDYSSTADGQELTDEWNYRHKEEPLIICNLDSIQGDERDTIFISTCYGKDKNDKFNLLTLGPLMNDGGKNRLNVAITRSRHRMIVVTSMRNAQLKALLSASKGQHIAGAKTLCDFLEYVESFEGNKNKYVAENAPMGLEGRICTLLADNGVSYVRKVGDSDCKIDIAICADKENEYKMGILLEATMNSANSVREYARLRDEMLEKHGWHLYHIWAIDWFRDFFGESKRLLEYIRDFNLLSN